MRLNNRKHNELRPVSIVREFTKYAEGSVLISFGHTKVICTASLVPGVPPFLRDSGKGWVTAEYGMLPRSTHERMQREAAKGKQTGRTQEIQRLIARSLRACVDLNALGENTITVDCDVIQADGGTRTAAITGGCIALYDALNIFCIKQQKPSPFKQFVAAVSVGLKEGTANLDLDYLEDSTADTDLNVVMTEKEALIELQGTAEHASFSETELLAMLSLAKGGIHELINLQKTSLRL